MSYGPLLKTQADGVWNAITKNGLDPGDFAWELITTPTLNYTPCGVDYLVDATHRQGRQDWLHVATGVLFTVVTGLVLAPDQAREIFRFASNVLRAILKTPPLLP